jgi:hypothetical protein
MIQRSEPERGRYAIGARTESATCIDHSPVTRIVTQRACELYGAEGDHGRLSVTLDKINLPVTREMRTTRPPWSVALLEWIFARAVR